MSVLRQRYEEPQIARCRIGLTDHIRTDLRRQLEMQAESVFRTKVTDGTILFKLDGAARAYHSQTVAEAKRWVFEPSDHV